MSSCQLLVYRTLRNETQEGPVFTGKRPGMMEALKGVGASMSVLRGESVWDLRREKKPILVELPRVTSPLKQSSSIELDHNILLLDEER